MVVVAPGTVVVVVVVVTVTVVEGVGRVDVVVATGGRTALAEDPQPAARPVATIPTAPSLTFDSLRNAATPQRYSPALQLAMARRETSLTYSRVGRAEGRDVGMRALRLLDWKSDPVIVEVDEPTPGPGEVVVRVGAAGACHSDLHLMHDFEPGMAPWAPPFTLGHENAGWVHAVGEGVEAFDIGQPVAVHGGWGCGGCDPCRSGNEPYCENPTATQAPGGGAGLGLDGGMAELMLVPSDRHLVALPDGLDPVAAAPLTDAGLTPYHAIRRSRHKLTEGSAAVLIGVGGLGHLGVQILKATTPAKIVAVDSRPEALALAVAGGADLALAPSVELASEIRTFTGGRGADVVVDFVGSDATLALGIAVARMRGDVTVVGIAGASFNWTFFSVPYEVSLQTTFWGSLPELKEVLDLGARGIIKATTTTFSLADAPIAYQRLAAGEIEGRAVIVPNAQ